ncbi:MAG: imidazolonepropionase [Acidimicrobiia bacterium]
MAGLLLTRIGQLVTNAPGARDLVGTIDDAAVAIEDGRVAWAGPEDDLPRSHQSLPVLDCEGRAVLPGFVDPHTHLVFAGDRADEFARRLEGESYEQVLASGGGIHRTVRETRAAERAELVDQAEVRLRRMLAHGTTTVEIKSGYGLETDTERRILETVAELARRVPMELVGTFLGGHLVPEEYEGDREGYLKLVEEEMLPACAPLARYCDVFCDRGAFTVEEARRLLAAGARHGLRPRLHANELGSTGGARLAAELGAVSADHLAFLDGEEIAGLRGAGTVAVLLPATSFSLGGARYAPGRQLWDGRVTVALGTDCNPGTSYTESMPFVIALACAEMGLSPAQALWSATRGGALALEEPAKGWLGPGSAGDLVVLDAPSYLHLSYRPGSNLAWKVVKGGEVVVT